MLKFTPTVSSTLQYPASCLACTYGGGFYLDGALFAGSATSPTLQWYRFTDTPAHLLSFHKFPRGNKDTTLDQAQASLAALSISTDCSRLYGMMVGKYSNSEYSIWLNAYEVDVVTGGTELTSAYIPLPLAIPKAYSYKLSPFPLSVGQAKASIEANGYMGVSSILPDLLQYCKVCQYKQYIFAMYPVYFEDFPMVYQILSVLDATTGRLVGAFCVGSVPAVGIIAGVATPLKTNMWVLDDRLWFTSVPPHAFSSYWGLPTRSEELTALWEAEGIVHDVWKDMYHTKEETASPVFIDMGAILDLLGHHTIYSPKWVPVTTAPNLMGNYNVTDFSALVPDLAGTFMYGVKGTRLQEYRIEYLQFETLQGGKWVPLQGLTYYYWQVLAGNSAEMPLRVSNCSANTIITNITIKLPDTIKIAVAGAVPQQNTLNIAKLIPDETVELVVKVEDSITETFTDQVQVEYTPIQEDI